MNAAPDICALIAELRANNPNPRGDHWEPPWTREDHEMARAEQRAEDKREGDPGQCLI